MARIFKYPQIPPVKIPNPQPHVIPNATNLATINDFYQIFMSPKDYKKTYMTTTPYESKFGNLVDNTLWDRVTAHIGKQRDMTKLDFKSLAFPGLSKEYQKALLAKADNPPKTLVQQTIKPPVKIGDLFLGSNLTLGDGKNTLSTIADVIFDHPGSYGVGSGIEEYVPILKFTSISIAAPVTFGLLQKFYSISYLVDYDPDSVEGQTELSVFMSKLPFSEFVTWTLLRTFPVFSKIMTRSKTPIVSLLHSPAYLEAMKRGKNWEFTDNDLFWYLYVYPMFDYNCMATERGYLAKLSHFVQWNIAYKNYIFNLTTLIQIAQRIGISAGTWRYLMYENTLEEDDTDPIVQWLKEKNV